MYDKERVDALLGRIDGAGVVDELIGLNYGLIHSQLEKFHLVGDPDAISYGYEALYKAIITFDHSKDTRFSTYATVCIYNRLGSYVRALNTSIRLNTVSYEVSTKDGPLIDLLHSSLTADSEVLSDCGIDVIRACIEECISLIPNELHRSIVNLWVDSDYTMTQVNIAKVLGCTQTYVSQVLKTFKHKLGGKLNERI